MYDKNLSDQGGFFKHVRIRGYVISYRNITVRPYKPKNCDLKSCA